mmetsp:Transcript_36629/g.95926  ORF Transcript_36629/g.95926 Transcript_36629/m.95926 type:complete len:238 (-) Transcript_36629:136-849(-)
MALVAVTNVDVLNNPAPFTADFAFEITFECIAELREDIEWKIIYVGSAESEEHDQVLDSILVGPVPIGLNKFVFEASAPNWTALPPSEIIGVTVALITCSYRGQEFVRIGYYVNNDYTDPEMKENPPVGIPAETMVQHLGRVILHDKPRVTRYTIDWEDGKENVAVPGGMIGAPSHEWAAEEAAAAAADADPEYHDKMYAAAAAGYDEAAYGEEEEDYDGMADGMVDGMELEEGLTA